MNRNKNVRDYPYVQNIVLNDHAFHTIINVDTIEQ